MAGAPGSASFAFGTKAQTLQWLRPLVHHSKIGELCFFDVNQWRRARDEVLAEIERRFGAARLAVRSSAVAEDGSDHSMAGRYTSCLNVDGGDSAALAEAIDRVVTSYGGNPRDQVLIQCMIEDIAVSGVITTHVLEDGAPYYVMNYDDESGKPDAITGGNSVSKTVLIHRRAGEEMIESDRVRRWLSMVQELEAVCGGTPLDVEFVQDGFEDRHLLQVRRITVERNWNRQVSQRVSSALEFVTGYVRERSRPRPALLGSRTILGEMPDWNPAEIISTSPRPLAVSLYRRLITDHVWREARARMGYRHPRGETLMTLIGGRPFIDVRNSFNSFLPADLPADIGARLVDAWLERLDRHPELHDKVEFEVALTALDCSFDRKLRNRYPGVLTAKEAATFREALRRLTLGCLDLGPTGTLTWAMERIARLQGLQAARRRPVQAAGKVHYFVMLSNLLRECERLGTLPFSIIARHAFIAEAILRSATEEGALSEDRLACFKSSLSTVAREMSEDLRAVCREELDASLFMERFGHLRPGTYDILSLRYDQREDLFRDVVLPGSGESPAAFRLTEPERTQLDRLLQTTGLEGLTAEALHRYCRKSMVAREHAKFVFSRNLSDALEWIARWGDEIGLTREDLSFLPLEVILDGMNNPVLEEEDHYFKRLADSGREAMEMTRSLRLSYLIRGARDVYVVPMQRAAPNFVTNRRVEGRVVVLSSRATSFPNLFGMLVCIENADPGFDWIFTRGIAGLVTKFGGSNSHMTIRCAELGLPAAIGCGELLFQRVVDAGRIELNCADRIIRPIYG